MALPLGVDQAITNGQAAPALTETGYVLARSTERNGAGGSVERYTKGAAISCDIAPKGGGKHVSAGSRAEKSSSEEKVDTRTENIILLPAGTEVNERDRIEIDGRGQFEVLLVDRRSVEILREVEAREAEPVDVS